jgi:hypothetical protein
MTNRIDRLVGRRLGLRREAGPAVGRSVLVTLTGDRRTRVDAAITRLVDAEAVLLGILSRQPTNASRGAAEAQPQLRRLSATTRRAAARRCRAGDRAKPVTDGDGTRAVGANVALAALLRRDAGERLFDVFAAPAQVVLPQVAQVVG